MTERHKVVFLARDHAKCHLVHLFLRCHTLGQGFGRRNHIKCLFRTTRKARKHICTENFVGGIALPVLHRPTVARRIKDGLAVANEMHHVVIEISGLFLI